MASTDTSPKTPKTRKADDLAGLEAGLDALDSVQIRRTPVREVLLKKVFPPVVAVALVLVVWQLLVWGKVTAEYKLPAPSAVWDSLTVMWREGTLLSVLWTSVSRALYGFFLALAIGTPLGLLVSRVKFVRAAIGPILAGLQSLPSVAWVAPAVLWLGLNDSMMYAVILLGAVPSIANGLVAACRPGPTALPAGRQDARRDRAQGRLAHRDAGRAPRLPGRAQAGLGVLLAFTDGRGDHRVLPDLGLGLGQLLEYGRNNIDMAGIFLAIILILVVGIAIDLLIFSPLERTVLRRRGLLTKS